MSLSQIKLASAHGSSRIFSFFRGLKRMFNFMPSGPIIQPLPTDPFLTIYFSKFSFHEYRSSCNAGKLHIYWERKRNRGVCVWLPGQYRCSEKIICNASCSWRHAKAGTIISQTFSSSPSTSGIWINHVVFFLNYKIGQSFRQRRASENIGFYVSLWFLLYSFMSSLSSLQRRIALW